MWYGELGGDADAFIVPPSTEPGTDGTSTDTHRTHPHHNTSHFASAGQSDGCAATDDDIHTVSSDAHQTRSHGHTDAPPSVQYPYFINSVRRPRVHEETKNDTVSSKRRAPPSSSTPAPRRRQQTAAKRGCDSVTEDAPTHPPVSVRTPKRKRVSGWASGWQRFYTALLCPGHDKRVMPLPPLDPAPSQFASIAAYYDTWTRFVTAEATAIIEEGCRGHVRNTDRQSAHGIHPAARRGTRKSLYSSGGSASIGPGFRDKSRSSHSTPTCHFVRQSHEDPIDKGAMLVELTCDVDVVSRGGLDQHMLLPGCIYALETPPSPSHSQHHHPPLLAVIVHSGTHGTRLVVSKAGLHHVDACMGGSGGVASVLRGQFVGSVLALERMAATCGDRPAPTFLHRLLGQRGPTHTFFSDDDDGDRDSDGDTARDGNMTTTKMVGNGKDQGDACFAASGACPDSLPVPSQSHDPRQHGRSNHATAHEGAGTTAQAHGTDGGLHKGLPPLNASQQAALDKAVAAASSVGGFEIVVGPPGCGKTHFLVALIATCVLHNVRVLVSAPSNKALCVALEKFLACPVGAQYGGTCRLVGNRDALATAATTSVPLSAQHPTLGNERHQHDAPTTQSDTNPKDHDTTPKDRDRTPNEQHDSMHSATVTSALDTLVYTFFETAAQRLEALVQRTFGPSMSGSSNCAWEGQFDALMDATLSAAPYAVRSGSPSVRDMVGVTREALSQLASSGDGDGGGGGISMTTDGLPTALHGRSRAQTEALRVVAPLVSSLRALHTAADSDSSIHTELLNSARVVFCTLVSAGQSTVRHMKRVDLLVVDESAQALEPEVLIALSSRPRALVLIGDPKQLPASVTLPSAKRLGYGKSMMERLLEGTGGAVGHLLDTQYRMHPKIAQWPNRHFYQGQLHNAPITQRRTLHGLVKRPHPYTFVDVPDGMESITSSKSIRNSREVDVVIKLLHGLQFKSTTVSIAVITFYAAQRTALGRAVASAGLCHRTVQVHTVDSFQGSEADVVIVSFVRSNPRGAVGFVADAQRLNVALTRARHHLIMVGNADCLASCTESDDLVALIRNARHRHRVAPLEF
eukprot:m.96121 g.96121  ORF g.96121 m.96121 type:complete len:1085 (+) comp10146_c1_seq1:214-3468(+)